MSNNPQELLAAVEALIARVVNEVIIPAQAEVTLLDDEDEPVTRVDIEAERQLSAGLQRLLPSASVIGEEATKSDPGLHRALEAPGSVWLVDPIDGTGNYAAGGSDFGTMVALVVDGETHGGWIWSRRDGAMFTATRGRGVRRDGVLVVARSDGAVGRGQLLDRFMDPELSAVTHAAVGPVMLVEPSCCAAVDYPAIVEGRLDFSVYGRVRPWDHAAGVLLVEEAGGHAQCLDGRLYRPARDDGGLVVSANATTLRAISDPIAEAVRSLFAEGTGG